MSALLLALLQVGIVSTKHNLSTSGPGNIKAQSQTQICIFCHIPHRGLALGGNRPQPTATYTPYNSTTMVSTPSAPTGATRMCLSCHDGTIALGQTVASGTISVLNTGPGGTMPSGNTNLGTDLRKTHPVSIVPGPSTQLRAPPPDDAVKLDARGRVQCTSCHDPHRDQIDSVQQKFLVKNNRGSALCETCHTKTYWVTNPSSHQVSTRFYDSTYGATTPYTTVADNGCESCHRPHAAGTPSRLLKNTGSQVCLQCHTGLVAQYNIQTDLAKQYGHPVLTGDATIHDESESPTNPTFRLPENSASQPRHAQCVDCHNPHAAYRLSAIAPNANGFLAGVWGISKIGAVVNPVQYEYEVCFKCHADSANQPQAAGPTPPETVRRSITDINLRRVFDNTTAASFHPVEGPGRNVDVPSLIAPLTTGSVVYCTDCHASDSSPAAGGTGPRGPHGSNNRHILIKNLETADNTVESPAAYELCYRCHSREVIRNNNPVDSGFKEHPKHLLNANAPCTACHDWHGVSSIQGNQVNNAHLINLDISIARPNSQGQFGYTSLGYRTGKCNLLCHGRDHIDSTYNP